MSDDTDKPVSPRSKAWSFLRHLSLTVVISSGLTLLVAVVVLLALYSRRHFVNEDQARKSVQQGVRSMLTVPASAKFEENAPLKYLHVSWFSSQ